MQHSIILILSITFLWSHKHDCLLVTTWWHLYTQAHGHTHTHTTYSIQSTAKINVMPLIGSPADVSTNTMAIMPPCGTSVAPIAAAVEMKLQTQMSEVLMIHLVYTRNVQATEWDWEAQSRNQTTFSLWGHRANWCITVLHGVYQYTLHSNIINAPYMVVQVQFGHDDRIDNSLWISTNSCQFTQFSTQNNESAITSNAH